MQWILKRLGIGGPEAQARQLNADARRILATAEGQYSAATLAEIARVLRERRDQVHALSLGNTQHYAQGLKHLTDVNAEFRRSNDQVPWTAVTLAIIYLKAELTGPPGDPARACIDDFLERFRFAADASEEASEEAPEEAPEETGEPDATAPFGRRRPWRG